MFLSKGPKGTVKQLVMLLPTLAPILVFSSFQFAEAKFDKRSVGEEIFRNRCTMCHGLDGGGETTLGKKYRIPDLRSQKVQHLADDELLEIIAGGRGDMPAFKKKLSRESIYEVISHLRKLTSN